MRALLPLACLFIVLTASGLCSAQGVAPTQGEGAVVSGDSVPVAARRWYGWQTFAADGVSAGLFLGAVADDHNTALFGLSAVTFAVGAPVVHLAHGQWEMALGSVGLRVVAPLLGAVIGSAADGKTSSNGSSDSGGSSSKWTTTGVAIGGVVASAIDGLVLAYDTRSTPAPAPARNQLLRVEPFPYLVVVQHGFAIGVSGAL